MLREPVCLGYPHPFRQQQNQLLPQDLFLLLRLPQVQAVLPWALLLTPLVYQVLVKAVQLIQNPLGLATLRVPNTV
jgi:hypothetical protein